MALDLQLPVASKPDSQDICFVPDGDYASFIEKTACRRFRRGILSFPTGQWWESIKASYTIL